MLFRSLPGITGYGPSPAPVCSVDVYVYSILVPGGVSSVVDRFNASNVEFDVAVAVEISTFFLSGRPAGTTKFRFGVLVVLKELLLITNIMSFVRSAVHVNAFCDSKKSPTYGGLVIFVATVGSASV